MPLEPSFKDKARREGIPTPFPAWGGVMMFYSSFVHKRFVAVRIRCSIPDFGRLWLARRDNENGSRARQNLPLTMSLTRQKRVQPRTGLYFLFGKNIASAVEQMNWLKKI
jgi:hypothetical protein